VEENAKTIACGNGKYETSSERVGGKLLE